MFHDAEVPLYTGVNCGLLPDARDWRAQLHPAMRTGQSDETKTLIKLVGVVGTQEYSSERVGLRMIDRRLKKKATETHPSELRVDEDVGEQAERGTVRDKSGHPYLNAIGSEASQGD
jgi:hypothetical protein